MNTIREADVARLREAIGRTQSNVQRLEAESLRRYALAVGADPDVEQVQPPLPHWAFFLPGAKDDELDVDGHPVRGGFLPVLPLPRRMFASASIQFTAPLLIGEEAELTARIVDIIHKAGRSGDLLFVEIERAIAQRGDRRIVERQNLVYRGASEGIAVPLPDTLDEPLPGEIWQPTSANLFRFSAVTFNSHRIHYDLPYATTVEGYPGLVIQGPFTAAKLAAFAARDGELASFSFRAQLPLFLGQPVRFLKNDDEVHAMRCDGAVAMIAGVAYK